MPRPPNARSRILSVKAAATAVAKARRAGERIVFTSGCFDLVHVGHVRSLEQAASYGDRLIVGVNGDARVRELKGAGRPIVPARKRAEVIAALACVDWVVVFGGATPRATLAALRPDVFAKGGDWPLETLLAQDVPPGLDIEVRRLRQIAGSRTTTLVERIRGR